MAQGTQSNRNSYSLLMGMKDGAVPLEDSLTVFYKTKHSLTYKPAIALLGIYSSELKTYVHIKTYAQIRL